MAEQDMNVLGAMEETIKTAKLRGGMPLDGNLGLIHLEDMLDQMQKQNFSYGKKCRWLGWAQAAVVASGAATLEEMKSVNWFHKDSSHG